MEQYQDVNENAYGQLGQPAQAVQAGQDVQAVQPGDMTPAADYYQGQMPYAAPATQDIMPPPEQVGQYAYPPMQAPYGGDIPSGMPMEPEVPPITETANDSVGSIASQIAEIEIESIIEQMPPYTGQYIGPGKPTDMKICDKYFIKPGEFGLASCGDLKPGTGAKSPNEFLDSDISVDELKEDIMQRFSDELRGSLKSFVGFGDECSIDKLKRRTDKEGEGQEEEEEEESEGEFVFESYDSEYLKNNLGVPLTLALAEIVAKKPVDPIHYLGHWLFKWRYNQEAKQAQIDKINNLICEREKLAEELAEKQRLADEKEALQEVENLLQDVTEGIDTEESGQIGSHYDNISGQDLQNECEDIGG